MVNLSSYCKVKKVSAEYVEYYISKGWVHIGEETSVAGPNETSITYHVGYPITSYIKDLKEIIALYEDTGLFEELIKRLSEEEGIDFKNIKQSPFIIEGNDTKTTDKLNLYVRTTGKSKQKGTFYYDEPKEVKVAPPVISNNSEDDLPF